MAKMQTTFRPWAAAVIATMLVSGSAAALAQHDDAQPVTGTAPATFTSPPSPALVPSLPMPVLPQASRGAASEESASKSSRGHSSAAERAEGASPVGAVLDATDPWTGKPLVETAGLRARLDHVDPWDDGAAAKAAKDRSSGPCRVDATDPWAPKP